jgi:hypothetical protein
MAVFKKSEKQVRSGTTCLQLTCQVFISLAAIIVEEFKLKANCLTIFITYSQILIKILLYFF